MEHLGLQGENDKNKTVTQMIEGPTTESVNKINKKLYHLVEEVVTPFGYTKYQLAKCKPPRLPNPPLLKLLYIAWVITDPNGEREEDMADDLEETTNEGEATQKINAICKEVSRRAGGICVYIPLVQNMEQAYTKFCEKFHLEHPTQPQRFSAQFSFSLPSLDFCPTFLSLFSST